MPSPSPEWRESVRGHWTIWIRDDVDTKYAVSDWRPSETCPHRETAERRARDMQEAMPFSAIAITDTGYPPVD